MQKEVTCQEAMFVPSLVGSDSVGTSDNHLMHFLVVHLLPGLNHERPTLQGGSCQLPCCLWDQNHPAMHGKNELLGETTPER